MKQIVFTIVIILFTVNQSLAQDRSTYSLIDLLLLKEENKKVIDTCKQLLVYDSLNPEIHFKLGIAYQNILEEELALSSFYKAANLDPENKSYTFSLAKGYYGKEKLKLAEPLLVRLCRQDSMNWVYAYYLASVYMQTEKYVDAGSIYKKFLMSDPDNCTYIDKLAFACLRNGDYQYATDLYNKSLSINNRNLPAVKNLAFLYAAANNSDTALYLLTKGIETDSTDMDLYARRAQINYSRNYTKRAMDDYLLILASGDSSKTFLKRVGIGYSYNLQPKQAIDYLLLAYKADSTDYETCSFLGQCYYKINNFRNSVYYYKKVIKILKPLDKQLGFTYVLYAESQKNNGYNKDAIDSYLKAYAIDGNPGNLMSVANIYDEKLGDKEKAIHYYQSFLDNLKNSVNIFPAEYVDKTKKRLEYLKNN